MLTLGINQDLYDCGVALADGRTVLYAANEERFTREKNAGGWPRHALAALFDHTGIAPAEIGRVAVAGEMTPPLPARLFPALQSWASRSRRERGDTFAKRLVDLLAFDTPLMRTSPDSLARRAFRPLLAPLVRRRLPASLDRGPICIVEHHRAHAASAWSLSGFEEALVVTADGMGDGLSATVSRATPAGIERLWSASARDSFGLFFEMFTEALGFIPSRDEGKLMALAAHGDRARVPVNDPFALVGGRLGYSGPRGRAGVRWARDLLDRHGRADVCAWAQAQLEHHLVEICRGWLRRSGLRRLAAAGGVFANVRLNQRLHELEEVEAFFVCPNMGDGGLSLGALCAAGGLAAQRLHDVFWGDAFTDAAIEAALREAGVRYRRCRPIETEVARLLASGRNVARFSGRMEWGPRALGNRSILAPACDAGVSERLNRCLARNDFMPFAPACAEEDADRYVVGAQSARHAAEFMTACFRGTAALRKEGPAAVHVDGTARLQVVRSAANPRLHAILGEYKRLTGVGVLLNTSFNVHQEPIVRTPGEAVRTFLAGGLDHLAAGDFLADGPHLAAAGVEGQVSKYFS